MATACVRSTTIAFEFGDRMPGRGLCLCRVLAPAALFVVRPYVCLQAGSTLLQEGYGRLSLRWCLDALCWLPPDARKTLLVGFCR